MASQISPRIICKIQKNFLFLHLKTAKKNMEIVLYILIGLAVGALVTFLLMNM